MRPHTWLFHRMWSLSGTTVIFPCPLPYQHTLSYSFVLNQIGGDTCPVTHLFSHLSWTRMPSSAFFASPFLATNNLSSPSFITFGQTQHFLLLLSFLLASLGDQLEPSGAAPTPSCRQEDPEACAATPFPKEFAGAPAPASTTSVVPRPPLYLLFLLALVSLFVF